MLPELPVPFDPQNAGACAPDQGRAPLLARLLADAQPPGPAAARTSASCATTGWPARPTPAWPACCTSSRGHALPAPDRRRRDRRPRPAGGGGVLDNGLLERTDLPAFYRSLEERFQGVAPGRSSTCWAPSPPAPGPYNFHVFHTYLRTGTLPAGLDTLEQCRVGWGTVLTATPHQVVVAPGRCWGGALVLGEPAPPPRPQPGRLHRLPRPGPWRSGGLPLGWVAAGSARTRAPRWSARRSATLANTL